MKYMTIGQASIDWLLVNGKRKQYSLGGPGVFSYTGIKLYDDSVKMLLNTAADFYEYYGDWIKKNNVAEDALYTCYDKTHTFEFEYNSDGSYNYLNQFSKDDLRSWATEYGYTNVRPYQIAEHCQDTKGVYLFLEPFYKEFYRQTKLVKDKYHFKIMYEIGIDSQTKYTRNQIIEILDILKPEMASLNHNEACDFFGSQNIEEIFQKIHALNFDMFFYRAGKKGSYVLTKGKSFFIPSIDIEGFSYKDQTGCGNTSTAASMWAWINTGNPVMTGILANIAAGFNVSYMGIIQDLNKENRLLAKRIAIDIYNKYVEDNPEYLKLGYKDKGEEILKGVIE